MLLLLCPPSSDEALELLRRIQRHSGLVLAETQPLHGELEDATARAYAAMGESDRAQVCADVKLRWCISTVSAV